jgi:hypothetical protein
MQHSNHDEDDFECSAAVDVSAGVFGSCSLDRLQPKLYFRGGVVQTKHSLQSFATADLNGDGKPDLVGISAVAPDTRVRRMDPQLAAL